MSSVDNESTTNTGLDPMAGAPTRPVYITEFEGCLLYTSDSAYDSSVVLL